MKNCLNDFDVATCINNAYYRSFIVPNIRSMFSKSLTWNLSTRRVDISELDVHFASNRAESVSYIDLVSFFCVIHVV